MKTLIANDAGIPLVGEAADRTLGGFAMVKRMERAMAEERARPFIKWAGGKAQLLSELLKHVPERFGNYWEPFVGGGALFFELHALGFLGKPPRASLGSWAILNDANVRLVRTWHALQDNAHGVVQYLRKYEERYEKEGTKFYYETRAAESHTTFAAGLDAAWFIFINKTCFNGLWRVNKKNVFNVPAGKFKGKHTICDAGNLYAVERALRNVAIWNKDFENASERVEKGDFWYADPPYVPASKTGNFTSYTADGFGPAEQERLRDIALKLKAKGVKVLLSNSDTEPVRELYGKEFEMRRVEARRAVNSKAERRGVVGELLIW